MIRTPAIEWDTRPIIKVEKIILHDPGNEQNASQVIRYLNSPANTHKVAYHDIIEHNQVFNFYPHHETAWHAGARFATPLWDRGSVGTQNRFSLGICVIRNKIDLDFFATYLGQLCRKHDLHPMDDILCHFQIHPTKDDPRIFFDDQARFKSFLEYIATKH